MRRLLPFHTRNIGITSAGKSRDLIGSNWFTTLKSLLLLPYSFDNLAFLAAKT
jgi:hypothetical protein